MHRLPARTGWLWIKQGFALFRKQPAEMATLFVGYMFLMLVLSILPVIGQLLPLMLVPVFSIAFMEACERIEQKKRVMPDVLMAGFRSPAMKRLIILGLLYLAAAVIAVASSALIDGGAFWQAMTGQAAPGTEAIAGGGLLLAMTFAATIYTPAAMAFWYAAPLIAWQDMPIGKALFFSFVAVYRQGRAFLVYSLGWAGVAIVLPTLLSLVLGILLSRQMIMVIVLIPLSIVMTVVMYCSFYPTYTDVFGKREPAPPPAV